MQFKTCSINGKKFEVYLLLFFHKQLMFITLLQISWLYDLIFARNFELFEIWYFHVSSLPRNLMECFVPMGYVLRVLTFLVSPYVLWYWFADVQIFLNPVWAGFFVDISSLDKQNDIKIGDFSSNSVDNILICSFRPYLQSCCRDNYKLKGHFFTFGRKLRGLNTVSGCDQRYLSTKREWVSVAIWMHVLKV